jgi:hypothetical protein
VGDGVGATVAVGVGAGPEPPITTDPLLVTLAGLPSLNLKFVNVRGDVVPPAPIAVKFNLNSVPAPASAENPLTEYAFPLTVPGVLAVHEMMKLLETVPAVSQMAPDPGSDRTAGLYVSVKV